MPYYRQRLESPAAVTAKVSWRGQTSAKTMQKTNPQPVSILQLGDTYILSLIGLDLRSCMTVSNGMGVAGEQISKCAVRQRLNLKGVRHEIFELQVFFINQCPIRTVLNFFENSMRYSRINVYQRCQRHRR
jgi:hypothetical protein